MKLWVYVVRRFLILVPTLLGLTFLMFVITHVGGNNILLAEYINPHLTGDARAQATAVLVARFHLSDPLYVQYFYWLWALIQGDLGQTVTPIGLPVSTAIVLFLPNTLLLTLAASVLTWIFAVPIGVYSAVRRDSILDQGVRVSSFTLYSMPVFLLGFIFLILYPVIGNVNPYLQIGLPDSWFDHSTGISYPTHILLFDSALHGYWSVTWDALLHTVLPALTLTLSLMAGIIRILRASMLEVMEQDYIRLARAKGVPERTVNNLHARKNALLPTVTSFGYLVAGLLSGAVVVEDVFTFKGVGWWVTAALVNGDTGAVLGSTFVFGVFLVLTTLVLDILYAVLDPRIRY